MLKGNDAEKRTKEKLEIEKSLREEINSEADKFDRAILTLSSAALGLTFSFNKIIDPFSQSSHVYFLVIAWLCFILSIFATLLSLIYSQKVRLLELNDLISSNSSTLKRDSLIEKLNITSAISFFIGVIFSFIFVVINI
jgi:hypothetical protein